MCDVNTKTPSIELATAVQAVSRAAVLTSWVQRRPGGIQRITKDDGSPVTIGDLGSSALIGQALRDRLHIGTPGHAPLISEEDSRFLRQPASIEHVERAVDALHQSKTWPDATHAQFLDAIDLGDGVIEQTKNDQGEVIDHAPFWTTDPIDGTKGFLRGQQYAVCLALVESGRPLVSAVACPNLSPDPARGVEVDEHGGCIVAADARDPEPGVWLIAAADALTPDRWKRIVREPLAPGQPARLVRSVERGHSDRSSMDRVITHLGDMTVPSEADGQCKYAMVALGRADAYIRIPKPDYRENTWDHAPGALLVLKAGGRVSDVLGNTPYFGDVKMNRTRGVIAAEPRTHQRIIDAIRDLKLTPSS